MITETKMNELMTRYYNRYCMGKMTLTELFEKEKQLRLKLVKGY